MRNYFSTHMLRSSLDFGSKAAAIEARHSGKSRFDIEHRGYVLASITAAVAFVEAMVNELFQDAADDHGTTGDGYVAPLSGRTRELMREWWELSGGGFERTLEKYQLLLVFSEHPKLNSGSEPYQSAADLLGLRNVLIHYRSESVTAGDEHRLERRLRGKFPDSRLMAGSGNPWWPSHALGAGCAEWSFSSAKQLADEVVDRIGIVPNYKRQEWA